MYSLGDEDTIILMSSGLFLPFGKVCVYDLLMGHVKDV